METFAALFNRMVAAYGVDLVDEALRGLDLKTQSGEMAATWRLRNLPHFHAWWCTRVQIKERTEASSEEVTDDSFA